MTVEPDLETRQNEEGVPTLRWGRSAAYTRTGIFFRFLEQLSAALPPVVDNGYVGAKLGLKGGDVRAFLQSLRVLDLINEEGVPTHRAQQMRARDRRANLIREALERAYPELLQRWDTQGGMERVEVEDFFKVEYRLSRSTSGPAAKLFLDLMREFGDARPPERKAPASAPPRAAAPPVPEPAAPAPPPVASAAPRLPAAPVSGASQDVRLTALEVIKASLHVHITAEWDEQRIGLVFDRMERLVGSIIGAVPEG